MPTIARAPYGLVAALMFVRFADEWFSFFPAGVLEPMRAGLRFSYAQGGAVLVALAGGGLVGVVFEVAADYVSRRALAALGALAYGLAMIGFGLADSFWGLMAAAFIWGAASDAFVPTETILPASIMSAGFGVERPVAGSTIDPAVR